VKVIYIERSLWTFSVSTPSPTAAASRAIREIVREFRKLKGYAKKGSKSVFADKKGFK